MTATALNTKISEVESKIPGTSSLVTTTVLNTNISEVANKIHGYAIYIATQEFNKLTAENVLSKTDFVNKLISFNRKTTSNKTKRL